MFDFDSRIERKGTSSVKFDSTLRRGRSPDTIPLWVADMDFAVPQCITDALTERIRHGVYGYTEIDESYFQAVYDWYASRFDYRPEFDWLTGTPGVVYAIAAAVRAFTCEGDSVLIQRPVYYPFSSVILKNNRKLINNALVYSPEGYKIDIDDFREKTVKNNVKLFILCSPHNPVSRVWSRAELGAMAEICLQNDVIIVSDEIHCDITFSPHTHTVFNTLSKDAAQRTVLCTSAGKTFNLAGLQVSNVFIENQELRREFRREIARTGYSLLNTMGLAATQAAYAKGAPWLDALLKYLKENYNLMSHALSEISGVSRLPLEGTYLQWIDFRYTGLSAKEVEERISKRAKLWLSEGKIFGSEGEGFQRINLAAPKQVIQQAADRLVEAFK